MTKRNDLTTKAMKRATSRGVNPYDTASAYASAYRRVWAENARRANQRATNVEKFTF